MERGDGSKSPAQGRLCSFDVYSRLSEAVCRSGEEVWCVICIFGRPFCLMSGNKIVGLIRIEREGQVGGIDRSQANVEGALLCVCSIV